MVFGKYLWYNEVQFKDRSSKKGGELIKTQYLHRGKAEKDRDFHLFSNVSLNLGSSFDRNKWILISFLLSLLAAVVCFAAASLWPFGGRSIMSMDAWGQYYPMLRELKYALENGNLFFSWNGGLGFDMLSQISYYTASPFWLILVLIPESFFTQAVHIIELLKFALAGMTFAILLEKKYGKRGPMQAAFAVSYAFSTYTVAFINQLMWFDAVILLPLTVLGIDRLTEEKKPLLYFISLALTVLSNFYIGFMACIFSLLYFAAAELTAKRTVNGHLRSILRFGLWSLLSGGASAVLLLPVYFSIKNTAAATLGFSGKLEIYHGFTEFAANLTPFSKISLEFGTANIYCGVLPLILFFAFLFCKKIPLLRRAVFGTFTAFMLLSLELNLLDFIWHGFHYPNQLPGRQSFMYVLLILMLAYEALINFEKTDVKAVIFAAVIPISVFLTALILGAATDEKPDFAFRTLTAGILLALLYLAVLSFLKVKSRRSQISAISFCISLMIIVEVVSSAAFMMSNQTRTNVCGSLTGYDGVMETVTAKYESGETDFYRTEWAPVYQFNPGMMYDFKGISYYSSMMSKGAYDFFLKCGYPVYARNVSTRYQVSPVTDAMLSVKYIYSRTDDTYPGYTFTESIDSIRVLENENCLPVAYMAAESILDFGEGHYASGNNAFEYQNDLLIATGAARKALYTRMEPDSQVLKNAVLRKDRGDTYYQRLDEKLPVSSVIQYEITKSGEYYISTRIKAGTVTVFINGNEHMSFSPSSSSLPFIGELSEGDSVAISFSSQGYGYALYGIDLWHFDREEFTEAVNCLKENGGQIEYASRSGLKLSIDAGQGGVLLTSIPYNGGWRLYCNGQNIPLKPIDGFLTCAELPPGEHLLEFSYVSPGFVPGVCITLLSVLTAVILSARVYSKKKQTGEGSKV